MDKLEIDYLPDEDELQKQKKLLAIALSKEEKVVRFMSENNIPIEVLAKNPARFQTWLDGQNKCVGCKGLLDCRQKVVGVRQGLSYDGILNFTLEECPFYLQKRQDTKHLDHFLVNDLGPLYHTVFFEKTDILKEQGDYLSVFIQAQQACQKKEGLYIYGNMGSGKTYLAACCCNEMARLGKTVAFVHMPTFVKRLDDIYQRRYAVGDFDEIEYLGFADLVVFDDIGAEHVNKYNRSILLSILEKRMQYERMTWFTSNEDLNSLHCHFKDTYSGEDVLESDRLLERIQVLAKPLCLTGPDRRKLQIPDKK